MNKVVSVIVFAFFAVAPMSQAAPIGGSKSYSTGSRAVYGSRSYSTGSTRISTTGRGFDWPDAIQDRSFTMRELPAAELGYSFRRESRYFGVNTSRFEQSFSDSRSNRPLFGRKDQLLGSGRHSIYGSKSRGRFFSQ